MRTLILLSVIFIYILSTAQTTAIVIDSLDFSKIKTSGAFDMKLIQSDKMRLLYLKTKKLRQEFIQLQRMDA